MTQNLSEMNLNEPILTAQYMPRSRINKLLGQAAQRQLVYVIAGTGYGKTQSLHHYVEQQESAIVRWMQLTESDNVSSSFWDHFTHNVSFDNPDLAQRLRELEFPDTLARFKKFGETVKTMEHRTRKIFLVFDDFHLIQSKQVLTFAERCAHLYVPAACMVVISRTEPDINTVSMFAKKKAAVITEEDLRFTDDEITAFFKFRGIPFSAKNLPELSETTKGWALAIQLLSLVLKRVPQNFEFALSTMKQNVFRLMEIEAFDELPKEVQKIVVRSALISDLPLAPLNVFSIDSSFLQANPQLSSFIWFDSLIGDYRIHPLYLEFLREKCHMLTPGEEQETYRLAAAWCSDNNFYTDAMRYFAKSHQYDRMLSTLLSYPFKLPRDTCGYFLGILEGMEADEKGRQDRSFLFLKNFFVPILLMGVGRYDEARERSFAIIKEWEMAEAPFALNLLYATYSNLAYIDMYTCTVTHQYNSPKYLKKSVEYFKLASVPPMPVKGAFAVADVRTFACLVGEGAELEEFDRFLEASRQTAFHVAETFHDMYYGYEDLVACEIAFYKNQLDEAKKYAHQTTLKAREKNQYSIAAMADHYFLRIALHEGDYLLAKETLNQLAGYLDNPNLWNRQLLYDLTLGYFCAQIGLPQITSPWLISDERDANSEIHSPVGELIVCVKNYIALKKYGQALTVLCNSHPREPQNRFLFGELILALLTALARIKTGDAPGAMEDFRRAYGLSFSGVFEMPFVELGKDLHPLVFAALEQPDCGIPEEWLKKTERKAYVYAKKAAVIRDSYKRENQIKTTIPLSEREREILNDLYQGLTREEIAETRFLSLPTVKKTIESAYIKLDAYNIADAIRIALKNNYIIE